MYRSSGRAVLFVALALAPLASCGGCFQTSAPAPSVPPPEVDSVTVRPRTILAEPGRTFTLEVVAKGKYGVRVSTEDPGISVAWAGAGLTIADPNDNPVTITVPDSPGGSFTLSATVAVAAQNQEFASDPVTVTVSPKENSASAATMVSSFGDSDWVLAEHPAKNPPEALLVQAAEGTNVVADWVVGVVGHVRLGRDLEEPGSVLGSEPSEAAIFSHARHAAVQPSPSLGQPWTTGVDSVKADPVDPAGYREITVLVGVDDTGMLVDGVPVGTWVKDQVEDAFGLLDRNRVGIDLAFYDVFEHKLEDNAGNAVAAEPANCASPGDFIPNWDSAPVGEHYLYVLYVPDIVSWPTDTATVAKHLTGWACGSAAGDDHRLIFLSWAEQNPATLAHEIGHILALATGHGAGAAGHVQGLNGFDINNLMWSVSAMIYSGARSHLTLGQVYRMNAQKASFVNVAAPPNWALDRDCQTTARVDCPALATDLGG